MRPSRIGIEKMGEEAKVISHRVVEGYERRPSNLGSSRRLNNQNSSNMSFALSPTPQGGGKNHSANFAQKAENAENILKKQTELPNKNKMFARKAPKGQKTGKY